MIDLRERTDTIFRDPLRERDLADLGIEAEVTIVGGPPHVATVTLTPSALDELISRASTEVSVGSISW